MRTLNYFLVDSYKHKAIVHQLDCIGEFLQTNVKHRVFVKLDSRCVEYFPGYANYFRIPLRLKSSMYDMNHYVKLFSYELNNRLIYESGFKCSRCKMSIYYKYAPDGSKLVVLSFVEDSVYWYTSE